MAEATLVNQKTESLGSEDGEGRSLVCLVDSGSSAVRFPDSSKAKAEVGGATAVWIARGFHGETYERRSHGGEWGGLMRTR